MNPQRDLWILVALALLVSARATAQDAKQAGTDVPATTATPKVAATPAATPSGISTPPAAAAAAPAASPTPSREDERTQTPAPAATPVAPEVSAGAFGNTTTGSAARARELLGQVDSWGITGGWFVAPGPWETRGVLRSDQTGSLIFRDRTVLGGELVIKARRDRAVYGPRGQADLAADPGPFQRWHDRISAEWRRRLTGDIRLLTLSAGYEGESGDMPELSAGLLAPLPSSTNVFGTPSRLAFDRRTFTAAASIQGQSGGVNFDADLRGRTDLLQRTFSAPDIVTGFPPGGVSITDQEHRGTVSASVSADGAPAPTVHIGGSLRSEYTHQPAESSRSIQSPLAPATTWRSEDINTDAWRHRAVMGASWFPWAGARASLRLQGESAQIYGRSIDDRDGPTAFVGDGHTAWKPWSTTGIAEFTVPILREVDLECTGRERLSGGSDDATNTLYLLDRSTVASTFVEDVSRPSQDAFGEARIVARPASLTRLFIGGNLEQDESYITDVQVSGIGAPPDRDRSTAGAFGGARTHFFGTTFDGKIRFSDQWLSTDDARSTRQVFDARLHAARPFGPVSIWATAAWTDDRLDDGPLGVAPPAGFAPMDFNARTAVGGGGVSWLSKEGFFTVNGTEAVATGNAQSQLEQLEASGGLPLSKACTLSAAVRWLQIHDDLAVLPNAAAFGGSIRLGGRF